MREQISTLLVLQEIDKQIVAEKKLQEKLPFQIREIENVITDIKRKLQKKKENFKDLQLKIKRKEIDTKTVNTKIEKHQDELYGGKVTDIKELKQLQKVIELLKVDRDKVEEDLLLLMEKEDDLRKDLIESEAELTKADGNLKQKQKEVEQQELEIKKQIEEKNKERAEIIKKVNDNELMNLYQLLWKDKEGKVVVEVDGPTCNGCNLSLPSDVIYHLQRDDILITCPNCNRILIWKK